jgi:hypothetical protein
LKTLAYIKRFETQLEAIKQLEKQAKPATASDSNRTTSDASPAPPVDISKHLLAMPIQASKEFINTWMIQIRCKMLLKRITEL